LLKALSGERSHLGAFERIYIPRITGEYRSNSNLIIIFPEMAASGREALDIREVESSTSSQIVTLRTNRLLPDALALRPSKVQLV
jgi:hypothetical protein